MNENLIVFTQKGFSILKNKYISLSLVENCLFNYILKAYYCFFFFYLIVDTHVLTKRKNYQNTTELNKLKSGEIFLL